MADSDKLELPAPPDSLHTILIDVASRASWKTAALLFVIFIIMASDIFDEQIISRFGGTMVDDTVTTWGVVVKGILLTLAFLTTDALVNGGFI